MNEKSPPNLLADKLRVLDRALMPYTTPDEGGQWDSLWTQIEVQNLATKLKLVLKINGYREEADEVDRILERHDDDFLFRVQEPFWHEGDYAVVVELRNFVENVRFSITSDDADGAFTIRSEYALLRRLLLNLDAAFAHRAPYPIAERDLHNLAESVLACAFPDLIHEPTISGTIKNFRPDTGIPATRTLIEYKFIDKPEKVPATVDQLFADGVGYADKSWDNLICVIYETERFVTLAAWKQELKKLPNVEVVLIKGTRP